MIKPKASSMGPARVTVQSDGNSAVHEDTVRECIEQFSYVEAD